MLTSAMAILMQTEVTGSTDSLAAGSEEGERLLDVNYELVDSYRAKNYDVRGKIIPGKE